MLRGVVPDSFPCQPTVLPVRAPGQRRFIVIDDNVHRIYGERIEQVLIYSLFRFHESIELQKEVVGHYHCTSVHVLKLSVVVFERNAKLLWKCKVSTLTRSAAQDWSICLCAILTTNH